MHEILNISIFKVVSPGMENIRFFKTLSGIATFINFRMNSNSLTLLGLSGVSNHIA